MRPAPLAALLALACTAAPRTAPPAPRFIHVNGVNLEVLDWGGTGTGLVFSEGLGDSPHAFDDIARFFTNDFHVVAYARRAHARSDTTPPYDNATLTEDLAQLMDSLGIRKAVLAGWSLGGTELSGMAIRHPDRVAGLVLLETYDYGRPDFLASLGTFPVNTSPDSADLAGPAAFRAYWKRVSSPNAPLTPAMDSEIAELTVPARDGRVHIVTDDSVSAAMFRGAMAWHPDFSAIKVPVLGIWTHWGTFGLIPRDAPDSLRRKVDAWSASTGHPFQDSTIARFRRAMPQGRYVTLEGGAHAIFPFEQHDTIIAELKAFLAPIR